MSSHFDLIIRGGTLVTPEGIRRAEVAVAEGRVAEIAASIGGRSTHEINATGLYVLPGFVDAHVHFNEPGRADWEGLATGSAALAAGGGTCFFDMPLNSEPPVLDAARLREKRALAEQKSCVDFALWGGMTPLNLDRLAEMAEAGAIGFKAFMSASGIDTFPRADDRTLREGMKRAAALGLIVAVHAEDDALAAKYTAQQRAAGGSDAAAWLASRPVDVEIAAIKTAIDLAGETGCALHIVHVSSPEGVAVITAARARGANVTAETCPHYLLLNAGDVARIGAAAKCAPPIRDEQRRLGLWQELRAGHIQTIGSDHSPAPQSLKTSPDFFAIWGGIGGCQHGSPLLLSACAESAESDWPRLVAALAQNVAQRFRIADRKGALQVGRDADLTLLSRGPEQVITTGELRTQHRISPYVGRTTTVRVTETYVRGKPAYQADAKAVPAARGEFVRPAVGA